MNSRFANFSQHALAPAIVALCSWLAVISTMDPGGTYPWLFEGPGITIDESFNVQQGILLVEIVRNYGPLLIDPAIHRELFGPESEIPYLPDHPPLGRFLLGIGHHAWLAMFTPTGVTSVDVTAAARFGSATMFGLTVFIVGFFAGKWFGKIAGYGAAISCVLMPRMFAHAHLASLETAVNLFVTLAVLVTADHWSTCIAQQENDSKGSRFYSWKWGLLPGFLLGLAMLTKIQGFLIIPCIIAWGLWIGRTRMIPVLLAWGITANLIFFLGWPWLWVAPFENLQTFLSSASDRVQLHNYYFGQQYADVETPWHYPWVMFLITVPIGIHLLGLLGWNSAMNSSQRSRSLLLTGCLLFPLLLFSTRAAVYDGSRLFLMCFPLWAVVVGAGAERVWNWLIERRSLKTAQLTFACGIAIQMLVIWGDHPCQLSYYNLLVGQLRGASVLGLETTYWQDSLTRTFWQDCEEIIPTGETISLGPVLHQFQLEDLTRQVPAIQKKKWQLVPATDKSSAAYRILFLRKADLSAEDFQLLSEAKPLVELKREGVLLAVLLQLPSSQTEAQIQ